ncbi:hypothetical protein HZB02_03300 [Candidatus Woesearchaeota archaeon]|nr:hypothetical protein [Candidatus Woesearchaeota archaeon]
MNPNSLESIGLTHGESKVYLALLHLGETKTGPLVKEAHVSSSKVYKILDRLIDKGLAGHVIKDKTKFFTPVEPRRVLGFLEQEEEKFHERKALVEKMLPELELEQNMGVKPKAAIFEGFKAVTHLLRNMLDEIGKGESYYVLGATYGDTPVIRSYFQQHHILRARKGIHVKMLANAEAKSNLVVTNIFSEIRYLPQQFASNMVIYLYQKKVIIAMLTKVPTAFVMENEEAVRSFLPYFEALWKIATK